MQNQVKPMLLALNYNWCAMTPCIHLEGLSMCMHTASSIAVREQTLSNAL